mgnify:CR=1 FL=1
MTDLYFLHGMESSPKGTKAQMLKEHFPQCIIPELPPDISKREKILDELISGDCLLVGSSLGGLSAILYAMKYPERVKGMILLAPAVGFYETGLFTDEEQDRIEQTCIPAGIKCTVFAALQDQVIRLESIKDLISRSPDKKLIHYQEVNDEHALNRYPELLLEQVGTMLQTVAS